MKSTTINLLLLLAISAHAQTVPPLVNYQGRLSNPDGSPLSTADYQLTFNIYDSVINSGGLVWGPQKFDGSNGVPGHGPKIPVVQGYFNVMLGPADTNGASLANAFNATNRFVQITIGTNQPISPRQQILTAPFAFQAANSTTLAGFDWSSILVGASNNPALGQIAGSKIQSGGITAQQIAASAITYDRLTSRSVSTSGTNMDIGGVAISRSSGVWDSPTPGLATAVPNLAVTIRTAGGPVRVLLTSAGSTNFANSIAGAGGENSSLNGASVNPPSFTVILFRNWTEVANRFCRVNAGTQLQLPSSSFEFLDYLAPQGTNVYSVKAAIYQPSGATMEFNNVVLVAFEL